MADVFLSYKREDHDRLKGLADGLGAQGFSVWWDQNLETGERWDAEIERQIALAACVVVAWTRRSVLSQNVRCEADFALEAGTLVPLRLDDCTLPLFQRTTQQHSLIGWAGDLQDENWQALVGRISAHVKARTRRGHSVGDPRTRLPMWGFGIAPPKPHVWKRYNSAAEIVRKLAQERKVGDLPVALEALSEVKGLFNRVRLKDQWDWFIVWQRFGFPNIGHIRKLAEAVAAIRTSAKAGEDIQPFVSAAKRENIVGVLNLFLGDSAQVRSENAGIAYVLSAKHKPGVSFAGVSTSGIVEIADKLNAALGLNSPLGVFHAWRVTDASKAFELIAAYAQEHNLGTPLDLLGTEVKLVNEPHGPLRDQIEQQLGSLGLIERYATKAVD